MCFGGGRRRRVGGSVVVVLVRGLTPDLILYWPVDRLREAFTGTQRAAAQDPDDAVRELTEDPDDDVESFFDRVHENLQAGRVRLVFVADEVPDELQRIVEFLNTQMSPAQVFAVEVKQYASPGFAGRTIVPRVIGRTASSMTKDGSGKGLLTAREYRDRATPTTIELGDRLAAWGPNLGLQVVETRQARTLMRSDRSVVARLYYSYEALDVDMTTVRERHGDANADALQARLQLLTSKPLSSKWPSMPATDAARGWDTLRGILEDLR